MASVKISEADILDAIAAAVGGSAPADARTTDELCAEFHCGPERMRRYLRLMHAAGRLVVHRIARRTFNGTMGLSTAYTVLPVKKAKK